MVDEGAAVVNDGRRDEAEAELWVRAEAQWVASRQRMWLQVPWDCMPLEDGWEVAPMVGPNGDVRIMAFDPEVWTTSRPAMGLDVAHEQTGPLPAAWQEVVDCALDAEEAP
jgi:hypothetical protein